MSAYLTCETEYRDGDTLASVLREMGYEVEVHSDAQPLYGYHGDVRATRAHVIVRRQHIGSSANDVGFERLADGRFRAHISEFDSKVHFGKEKQATLRRRYATAVVKKTARARGYRVVEEKAEGGHTKIRLQRFA